jgi:hypothetical protein
MDNLSAAIDASHMVVASVGYDNTGDPMTLLLKDGTISLGRSDYM